MRKLRIPKHVAIIPDGNRRWAVENRMEKKDGYAYGLLPGLEVLRRAKEYCIREITYYGFTTDNCKRPKKQQDAFKKACVDAVKMIHEEGDVELLVVGDYESPNFPKELLEYTTRKQIGVPRIRVNFLVNYGWEWDLSNLTDCHGKKGKLVSEVHSRDISRVDLVIRWGNMRRLSGMLPIQSVYSDFYVVENFWPNYKDEDFHRAIAWYDKQDVTLGG